MFDFLIYLACLSVPLFLTGTTLLYFYMIVFEIRREGRQWGEIADSLGLQPEPLTRRRLLTGTRPAIEQNLRGYRRRYPVFCTAKRHGGNQQTFGSGATHTVRTEVMLLRPLALGLRGGSGNAILRLFGMPPWSEPLKLGQLDGGYRFAAVAESDAIALLSFRPLNDALVAQSRAGFSLGLTDSKIWIEHSSFDPDTIVRGLEAALDLAEQVEAAVESIGPSVSDQEIEREWGEVARRHGMALRMPGPHLSGRLRGVSVDAQIVPDGIHRSTRLRVCFSHPLGIEGNLSNRGAKHNGALSNLADVQIGDKAFDQRFVIRAEQPSVLRALLTKEVREQLLHLDERTHSLMLTDEHLQVSLFYRIDDGARLEVALMALADVGAALSQAQSQREGAYRSAL